jgi:spore maturation protein CgeB
MTAPGHAALRPSTRQSAGTQPRYLFIGSSVSWGTSESRRRALVRLGRETSSLAYEPYQSRLKSLARIEVRTAMGPGPLRLNLAIVRAARAARPDIVWVDRGSLVWPGTLQRLRALHVLLVHYNTDDLRNPRNFWGNLCRAIPCYDVHITTNIPNQRDLPAMGAQCVISSQLAFDDELYAPRNFDVSEMQHWAASVRFIGHWEPATEELLLSGMESGLSIKIRGHNWHKARSPTLKRLGRAGPLYLEGYAKAIAASKINLGIVSTWNRNQTAGRTFEIPACGGFLLAPRTDEIGQLYDEDKEAVFFADARELADKALFYLAHDALRKHIAESGQRRCITSGYAWLDRMRSLVSPLEAKVTT